MQNNQSSLPNELSVFFFYIYIFGLYSKNSCPTNILMISWANKKYLLLDIKQSAIIRKSQKGDKVIEVWPLLVLFQPAVKILKWDIGCTWCSNMHFRIGTFYNLMSREERPTNLSARKEPLQKLWGVCRWPVSWQCLSLSNIPSFSRGSQSDFVGGRSTQNLVIIS